jgi:hypothetical protein
LGRLIANEPVDQSLSEKGDWLPDVIVAVACAHKMEGACPLFWTVAHSSTTAEQPSFPDSSMPAHDPLFKNVLKEFFAEFFALFLPEWANLFDFASVEWLDQEVFPDPPEGRRRVLDLVAKLRTREPVGAERTLVALVHTEITSADSVTELRQYMFQAYSSLRMRHGLPVLPVALYLRVGLDGVGTDAYEERFGSFHVLRLQYIYVGLPALDAVQYLEKENVLGCALAALMKVSPERRAWLKAQALERLARAGQNELRTHMLSECVDTYLPLDRPEEREEFERLIAKDEYREAKTMTTTWFREGMEQGLEQGQRRMIAALLEDRFGPLSEEVHRRLEQWPAGRLTDLGRQVLRAGSLGELGLEDDAGGNGAPTIEGGV